MIISSANDYREAARRSVLTFIFHYAYGGSYAEKTLPHDGANVLACAS